MLHYLVTMQTRLRWFPKPSFRVPWRAGDTAVGGENAGWTTSKSGRLQPMPQLLTMTSRRKDWKKLSADSPSRTHKYSKHTNIRNIKDMSETYEYKSMHTDISSVHINSPNTKKIPFSFKFLFGLSWLFVPSYFAVSLSAPVKKHKPYGCEK